MIAVKSNIISEEYENDEMIGLETNCVRIPLASGFLYVYSLYIQPSAHIDIYRSHIKAIRRLISDTNKNDFMKIAGDFNLADTTDWIENDSGFDYIPVIGESMSQKAIIARHVTSEMMDMGLFQISTFSGPKGNVLGLVYTNFPELSVVANAFRMLPEEKSDACHIPIMCTIDCAPSFCGNETTETIYCFKRGDYDGVREHFDTIGLHNIFAHASSNVSDMTSELYRIIYDSFENFIKTTSVRSSNEPIWYDKHLSHLKNLRCVYVNYDDDIADLMSFINQRCDTNCFNIDITEESVFAVLSTMDLSKGSGFDGVSSIFLRECAEQMSRPLSDIFRQSLREGIYPDQFKIGQVTPIFKAGRRNDVRNYRGVNVLPNLAKVFEKVIYNQMRLIITPKISTTQHGFLSNRGIDTNLMESTVLIHDAFEQKAQIDALYADIEGAFDKVNPPKLVRKMANFPISNVTLRWFISYLQSRLQYVKVGSSRSKRFDVLSGVGQGTILGPLLFIIFFNDSDSSCPLIFDFNFADDKKKMAIINNRRLCWASESNFGIS